MSGKVSNEADRRVTVAGLARELGMSPTWLVKLCLEEKVPGVTDETSLLSPAWQRWARDRALQHPELAVQQQATRSRVEQRSATFEGQDGGGCWSDQAVVDVEETVAKARDLIAGQHFDCVMLTLYAAIEGELKARDSHGHRPDNGLIDSVLDGLEYETIRKDLHRIRALTNRVRHDRLVPSHYDAEKALWVYGWLFGPHGKFGQMSQKSA